MNTVPKPDTLAPYSAFGTTIEFTQSIEDSQALQQLANAITALSPKPAPDPTAFTTNKTDTDLPELAFLLTLDGHLAPEDLLSFNRPAIDKAKQAASVASPKIDDIFSELRGRFGEVEAHPLWRAWIQRSSPGER